MHDASKRVIMYMYQGRPTMIKSILLEAMFQTIVILEMTYRRTKIQAIADLSERITIVYANHTD
jgi:hypothetical protein